MRKSLLSPLVLLALCAAATAAGAAEPDRPPVSMTAAVAPLETVPVQALPTQSNDALLAAAEAREARMPMRIFAAPIAVGLRPTETGTWERLADGSELWRLRIRSPGATLLNLRFSRFELPAGAALWLYDVGRAHRLGPLRAGDQNHLGELWTGDLPGDDIVVELALPAGQRDRLDLEIAAVNHGFRSFLPTKSHGTCNNDVICPEGDPWRQQIRSVARLRIGGFILCSGQLVNNTALDGTPYLLGANHCYADDVFEAPDPALVASTEAVFNFDAPTCGQQAGGSLGQVVSGAVLRAAHPPSDFLLAELTSPVPASFDAYYSGWDVTGNTPGGAVGIHHPSGDVKSISFENDPLNDDPTFGADFWRVNDWDDGTTEGGSSGSCIFDPISKRCVGVLTGGLAACGNNQWDFYGKLSAAWTGGGTAASRLMDWLDPLDTGATVLDGLEPGTTPGGCVPDATTLCLNDGRFKVEIDWRDFRDRRGPGMTVPFGTVDSGLFYFFNPNNWEVLVKVLDNCNGPTNRFWVFAAATTNVEYTLRVTDTQSNLPPETYFNPLGQDSPAITDTDAFATCP